MHVRALVVKGTIPLDICCLFYARGFPCFLDSVNLPRCVNVGSYQVCKYQEMRSVLTQETRIGK